MFSSLLDRGLDIGTTLCCWLYFTLGFVCFFAPFYILALVFSSQPEQVFQRYQRRYLRSFFFLLRLLAPRKHWLVDEGIAAIHSAVVVCNHRSYLDPLLLIASLSRAKTVVKATFFSVPIFSWFLRRTGYFPASGARSDLLFEQMERMKAYLASGGNFFVFPEGARNQSATIKELHPGSLKIARNCQAPLYVLCVSNTDRLFPPGRFFFTTRSASTIVLRIVDHIPAPWEISLSDLAQRVQQSMEAAIALNDRQSD